MLSGSVLVVSLALFGILVLGSLVWFKYLVYIVGSLEWFIATDTLQKLMVLVVLAFWLWFTGMVHSC